MRDKDYGWILSVLSCFFLTGFFLWLFSKVLPFLLTIIEIKDKIFSDFWVQMANFENLVGWVFIGIITLVLSAILVGIFIKLCRYSSRKIKINKFDKQKVFR